MAQWKLRPNKTCGMYKINGTQNRWTPVKLKFTQYMYMKTQGEFKDFLSLQLLRPVSLSPKTRGNRPEKPAKQV